MTEFDSFREQMAMTNPPRSTATSAIAVPIADVRQLLLALLVRKSLFEFDAQTVIDRMLEADILGDSDAGVASIATILDRMDQGEIDPRARILTETETAGIAVLDGSCAVGHIAATQGMKLAIDKARAVGTGTVVVHHSHHFGAAVLYANMAAASGMIGLVTSNIGPATIPAQEGGQPIVTQHPLVISVPQGDACLSIDLAAPASPVGLSLTASILAGLLSGGRLPIVKPATATTNGEHFFLAIDIETFTESGRFGKKLLDGITAITAADPQLSRLLKVLPLSPLGSTSAGDGGAEAAQTISLPSSSVQVLATAARQLKIDAPWLAK